MGETASGYQLTYWRDRAEQIAQMYDGDIEIAHSEEDSLLAEFVKAVAEDLVADPIRAAAAIYTRLLSVPRTRWYA